MELCWNKMIIILVFEKGSLKKLIIWNVENLRNIKGWKVLV